MDPDPMEPLGIAEVAALAEVKPETVIKWRYRRLMVAPRWHVNAGKTPLWARRDVVAWLISTGRYPTA